MFLENQIRLALFGKLINFLKGDTMETSFNGTSYVVQKDNVDSIFTSLMDRYKQENESVILKFSLGLMLVSNFIMSSFLVVTVISN